MNNIVLLDAGPLGLVSHPRASTDAVAWLAGLVAGGAQVLVPEIADYEVRRELLRANRLKGIRRLDQLKTSLGYLPITTAAMLKAAEFWADARRQGHPTAHDAALDADVILAGQAATIGKRKVIVASTNPRHLQRFVAAEHWQNIVI